MRRSGIEPRLAMIGHVKGSIPIAQEGEQDDDGKFPNNDSNESPRRPLGKV